MSEAVFGANCACGARFIRPAPTFQDVIPAMDAYAAAGWGHGPAPHHFVRCPSCLAAGEPRALPPAPPPPEPDLFS